MELEELLMDCGVKQTAKYTKLFAKDAKEKITTLAPFAHPSHLCG